MCFNSAYCPFTAPSAPPQNVTTVEVSSTSVRLSWSPPTFSSRNGIITEYRINVTELTSGRQWLLTSFGTGFVVQNLHPYYAYEFLVSAHTVATGPSSEPHSVLTFEDGKME